MYFKTLFYTVVFINRYMRSLRRYIDDLNITFYQSCPECSIPYNN